MADAQTLLVAGTASHVGKSVVAAGLCRLLVDRGLDVAPFKAQNMSNNARAVPGGEIGVSQYVQARAARTAPTTDHNPVLLKPRGNGESQLLIDGTAVDNVAAGEYYDTHWQTARAAAADAHDRLAATHDCIIAEGAGSIAEINLQHRDLANIETARFADADILLVADIERGGVFASVYGTIELLPDDIRERVVGVVINKFRGDRDLLASGIAELEAKTDVPVVGILPYDPPGLPAEDSLSLPPVGERAIRGDGDGVPADRTVRIAVPRLPRISNFTDLAPLAAEPGVRVVYEPLDAELTDIDAVVLPGSKNTVDDLSALREAGFGTVIREFDGPIIGLCGGYQMLGERLRNAEIEGTGSETTVPGFGLLPAETRFREDKRVQPVTVDVTGVGPLAGVDTTVSGYEIHMGRTVALSDQPRGFGPNGLATDRILGTYLHGLFENRPVREAFLTTLRTAADIDHPTTSVTPSMSTPYETAADLVSELDLSGLDIV